jgi:hypothetical protein
MENETHKETETSEKQELALSLLKEIRQTNRLNSRWLKAAAIALILIAALQTLTMLMPLIVMILARFYR